MRKLEKPAGRFEAAIPKYAIFFSYYREYGGLEFNN